MKLDNLLIAFIIVYALCCGAYTIHIYSNITEERSIVVINKSSEIVSLVFSSATEYLILGDDGVVYRTRDWKIYHDMEIGKRYNISVKQIHDFNSDYWFIDEVKSEVRNY